MNERSDRDRLLGVYLSDHLAGSMAGTRLARRLAEAERDGPDGGELARLADEIAQDRDDLVRLVDSLGVQPRRYKQVLAWFAERAARLKLNGRVVRRSPLTPVVEMEALLVALRGKLAGWETLRAVFGGRPVEGIDLDRLIARGSGHLETLSALHGAAATRAFGAPPSS